MSVRDRTGSASRRRLGRTGGVAFPVTPMLDMAFQLLAFFILTFQAPTREARIDLYLPSIAMALPPVDESAGPPGPEGEGDLVVAIRSDESGKMLSLTLDDRPLLGPAELQEALYRLRRSRGPKILRVAILAEDRLQYEDAARVLGACSAAGVDAIRLADASAVEARRP